MWFCKCHWQKYKENIRNRLHVVMLNQQEKALNSLKLEIEAQTSFVHLKRKIDKKHVL